MIHLSVKLLSVVCLVISSTGSGHLENKIDYKQKRTNSFIQFIKDKAAKHQVMILIDSNSSSPVPRINDFVRKISHSVPTLSRTFDHANASSYENLLGNNPRESTLFVIIVDSDADSFYSRLSVPIKSLIKLSNENARPKCLIVHFLKDGHMNYEKILSKLWMKQFLDVTILQLVDRNLSTGNTLLIKEKRVPTLHQFNPYNKIYSAKKSWLKSEWFPDKDSNFYKYEMKILFPFMNLNNTKLFRILSEKLNFTEKYIFAFGKEAGEFSCHRGKATGQYAKLFRNEMQFLMHPMKYFHNCRKPVFLRSRVLKFDTYSAVIPRLLLHNRENLVTWQFIKAILGNILIIFVLRLVALSLKFRNESWQSLNIVSVIFGGGFSTVPKSYRERIVFGSILLTSMVYAGYLQSLLTDVDLQANHELEINTIEDLVNSDLGLKTKMKRFKSSHLQTHKSYLDQFSEKLETFPVNYTDDICLKDLLLHKNITCIMPTNQVPQRLAAYRMKSSKIEMKIVAEGMFYYAQIFIMEPGASYSDKLNKEILQLVETGVMSKLGIYDSFKEASIATDELMENNSGTSFHRLFLVLGIGYIISGTVLIAEIIIRLLAMKTKREKMKKGYSRKK